MKGFNKLLNEYLGKLGKRNVSERIQQVVKWIPKLGKQKCKLERIQQVVKWMPIAWQA